MFYCNNCGSRLRQEEGMDRSNVKLLLWYCLDCGNEVYKQDNKELALSLLTMGVKRDYPLITKLTGYTKEDIESLDYKGWEKYQVWKSRVKK